MILFLSLYSNLYNPVGLVPTLAASWTSNPVLCSLPSSCNCSLDCGTLSSNIVYLNLLLPCNTPILTSSDLLVLWDLLIGCNLCRYSYKCNLCVHLDSVTFSCQNAVSDLVNPICVKTHCCHVSKCVLRIHNLASSHMSSSSCTSLVFPFFS